MKIIVDRNIQFCAGDDEMWDDIRGVELNRSQFFDLVESWILPSGVGNDVAWRLQKSFG